MANNGNIRVIHLIHLVDVSSEQINDLPLLLFANKNIDILIPINKRRDNPAISTKYVRYFCIPFRLTSNTVYRYQ